jgi:hypothetical protein
MRVQTLERYRAAMGFCRGHRIGGALDCASTRCDPSRCSGQDIATTVMPLNCVFDHTVLASMVLKMRSGGPVAGRRSGQTAAV